VAYPVAMSRKIRRKVKKSKAERSIKRRVRLQRHEAMEIRSISMNNGLEEAKKYLRMIRPRLDEVAVHEVAWRCADPMERGGIETGSDADGDYADVAVTA